MAVGRDGRGALGRRDLADGDRGGAGRSSLSIPGSLLPWDWFSAGGLVIGIPLALAAIVLGVRVRRVTQPATTAARMALAGVALGVAALLIPAAFITASVFG